MTPEIYSDDNGQRVVLRHTGPPGRGVPSGGTAGQVFVKLSSDDFDTAWANPSDPVGAIVGPASSTDGAVILFDGTTGELAKDSTRTLTWFASRGYVDAAFEPKVTGKGLSENDFTDEDKAKLDVLSETGLFFGNFVDLEALEESVDVPVAGNYATVDGAPATLYFWDATETAWVASTGEDPTGEEIAAAVFNDGDSASYTQATCRIFTTDYLVMLEAHDATLSLAGLGATSYVEKTADYVITNNDKVINVTANSPTLTLPTAVANTGRQFTIKNSGSGSVTLEGSGIETIDGDLNYVLATQWESVTVLSNGSTWLIL